MKNLTYVYILSILALFMSCSNEEDYSGSNTNGKTKSERNYVFGYKTTKGDIETRAAIHTSFEWSQNSSISIKFLNGTDLAKDKVKSVSMQWTNLINLKFNFVDDNENADVRIGFNYNGDMVSWSYIGTSCLSVRRQSKPTMNLQLFDDTDPEEVNSEDFEAIILREFGHMLGLINENLRPDSGVELDEIKTVNYFLSMGWDEDMIYENILEPYNKDIESISAFDENSIMLPFIPPFLSKNGIGTNKFNTKLTDQDKELISYKYPLPKPVEHVRYMTMGTYYSGAYGLLGYNYETKVVQAGGFIEKQYKTVEVGEYEWTKENLKIKYRNLWATLYEFMNHTQTKINAVTKTNNVYTVDDFEDIFGTWVNCYQEARSYRYGYKFYKTDESGAVTSDEITGFNLPSTEDLLQLIGQCPVETGNVYLDLARFVYATPADLKGYDFNSPYIKEAKNTSGLSFTPLGLKGNNPDDTGAHYSFGYGMALQMRSEGRLFILADVAGKIEVNAYLYHFSQARYCRPKTDVELGYKVYVDEAKDKVIILGLKDAVSSGLKELPKGLERGIVIRSSNILDKKVYQSWSKIKEEAARIKKQIRITN